MTIKNVALIGLGAMGAFFAPKLEKALNHEHFFVIAEGNRKKRLEGQGVTINKVNYKFNIIEPNDSIKMDLIIMAVKDLQLDQAIHDIKNFVGENTQIMCVMNGVDSEEKLINVFGSEHVIYSYMRVSIAMKDGHADYNPDLGSVYFGEKTNLDISPRVQAIKDLFDQAAIRYHIDEDMIRGIWFKFMCNVAENLTCALLGIPFGAYHVSEHANAIRRKAMKEVLTIANKKGVALSSDDIEKQEATIKQIPFPNKPSTLQDLEQAKKTEIDMFAGRVLALGEELDIDTPMCFMYFHGIKVLEEKNDNFFINY